MSFLPDSPSLECLKKKAKSLLKSFRNGDASTFDIVRLHPALTGLSDDELLKAELSLQQVQYAFAKHYGFSSWKDLLSDIQVRFAVFAPSGRTAEVESLCREITSGRFSVRTVESLEDALKTDANVLVFDLPKDYDAHLTADMVRQLQARKIIGFDCGCEAVFGRLGTGLRDTVLSHNLKEVIDADGKQFAVWHPAATGPAGPFLELFIPAKSEKAKMIEVLSRSVSSPNYAVTAQRGNHLWVTIRAQVSGWTEEFKAHVVELLNALEQREATPFEKLRWSTTPAGTYPFQLAQGFSAKDLSSQIFRFRLNEPGKVSVRVRHSGSSKFSAFFMGITDAGERLHWFREDAGSGEDIEISAEISADDIDRLGAELWLVQVANWDKDSRAQGTVEISY